jgi:hypothetical protein
MGVEKKIGPVKYDIVRSDSSKAYADFEIHPLVFKHCETKIYKWPDFLSLRVIKIVKKTFSQIL